MAMADSQPMQTDGPVDAQVPVPSSSRQNGHAATVEDEPEQGAELSGDVEMKPAEEVASKKKVQADEEEEDEGKLPANATETLYLQNLNEKVQVKVMKQSLALLFKSYKPLEPIIMHGNLRMRGQAFISFPDVETANRARKEVAKFPLYGRPMQLSFANTRSDSVIRKLSNDEELEEHKKARLEHKKAVRRNNPHRQKAQAKLKSAAEATVDGAAAPAARRAQIQMPDEYLPPNKVLFLQNLPEGTTSDDLQEVFEVHPNLVEIRVIPTKKDIAFVEYADEASATLAKEALHNFKIDGETKMKVTYARK